MIPAAKHLLRYDPTPTETATRFVWLPSSQLINTSNIFSNRMYTPLRLAVSLSLRRRRLKCQASRPPCPRVPWHGGVAESTNSAPQPLHRLRHPPTKRTEQRGFDPTASPPTASPGYYVGDGFVLTDEDLLLGDNSNFGVLSPPLALALPLRSRLPREA